jgi:acyl-CoA hydrolase
VTEHLTADEAAARIAAVDSIGMPLGPGQPPGFLEALGRRTDWEDLRINGALLSVFTDLFTHPNVHYLSGFYGPLERILRDSGANIGFAPADFRRFVPLLEHLAPRAMVTAGAPPDADGRVSLSLHAGANVEEMRRASAAPDRLLIIEVSEHFPRTYGAGEHVHSFAVDEIDIVVETDKAPVETEDPPPTDVDRAIADHVRQLVPDGATLQTGIGAVPSMVATLLAEGDGGGYGIHSASSTTGSTRTTRWRSSPSTS